MDRLATALADRYAIERELGAGGMATVYLAEDRKHKRRVAVKVLRPELAAVLGAERFLREIEITAGLTHPHILTLLDSGEADGFLFYVMPYAEGESLRDRLRREKQLPVDDAVHYARQVADALAYAHSRDVIHRDIKPENILLEAGHAVIADFGIARAISTAGGDRLTETGMAVGTPAYMSPEQASGEPELDRRSDVYALGCVLYEMLAGQPPFTGPTAESVVRQHVAVEAPPVTNLRPTVSTEIAVTVARALAKAPPDRFGTAAQLGEALATSSAATTPAPETTVPAQRRTRSIAIAAIVLVGVAVAMTLRPTGGVALFPDRVVVGVFTNETGDPALDPIGRMASDWITQGLQEAGIGVIAWPTALQSSLFVQAEADAGRVRDPVRALAEETAAGTVVSGSFYRSGDAIELRVHVTDAVRGRPLGSPDPVRGSPGDPSDAIQRLRDGVMSLLAVTTDNRLAGAVETTSQLPTFEAYQAFNQGMVHYVRAENPEAIPYFSRAFQLDTTFFTALLYEAIVSPMPRRDSILHILGDSRTRLSPYLRHMRDHFDTWIHDGMAVALPAIRRAADLAPGSKAVYNLAWAAVNANRPQEAVDALLSLDPERGVTRGQPSYWTQLTRAYHMLGQFDDELRASRRGRELDPSPGVALALLKNETRALGALGRVDELNRLIDTAITLPRVGGYTPGYVMVQAGQELRAHGFADAAKEYFDRAVDWYRALPASARTGGAFGDNGQMGEALYYAERWDEAETHYREMLERFPDARWVQRRLGTLAARRGDRDGALRISAGWTASGAETSCIWSADTREIRLASPLSWANASVPSSCGETPSLKAPTWTGFPTEKSITSRFAIISRFRN